MAAVQYDAHYVTTPFALSTTGETVVYTVPTGKYAYVTQIWAADTAGAARTLTVKIVYGGTTYTLLYQGAIAANDALNREFMPLQLTAADTVKVTASNGSVNGFITCHEGSRRT